MNNNLQLLQSSVLTGIYIAVTLPSIQTEHLQETPNSPVSLRVISLAPWPQASRHLLSVTIAGVVFPGVSRTWNLTGGTPRTAYTASQVRLRCFIRRVLFTADRRPPDGQSTVYLFICCGHLGCPQFLAITDKTSRNIQAHVLVWIHSLLLGRRPGVWLLG